MVVSEVSVVVYQIYRWVRVVPIAPVVGGGAPAPFAHNTSSKSQCLPRHGDRGGRRAEGLFGSRSATRTSLNESCGTTCPTPSWLDTSDWPP